METKETVFLCIICEVKQYGNCLIIFVIFNNEVSKPVSNFVMELITINLLGGVVLGRIGSVTRILPPYCVIIILKKTWCFKLYQLSHILDLFEEFYRNLEGKSTDCSFPVRNVDSHCALTFSYPITDPFKQYAFI